MKPTPLIFLIVAAAIASLLGCADSAHAPASNLAQAIAAELPQSEDYAPLDSMLDRAVADSQVPGGIALVVKEGEVVHFRAFGYADPLEQNRMPEEAIFRICSQTKALTSSAAMILWERGLLGLDDPVSKYIPAMGSMGVIEEFFTDSTCSTRPATSTMTVRHLMTHQAGLSYGEIGDPRFKMLYEKQGVKDLFSNDPLTAEENCNRLSTTALIHDPGAQWNYSLGLDVLVRVIEVASGEPFDDFLRREVLEPLGMNDTYFYLPDSLEDRLVPVWEPDSLSTWALHTHPLYRTDYPVAGAKTYLSGGAGLCSTPLDYAKFLQMYLNLGEFNSQRILRESTIDTIMANQEVQLRESTWHQGLAFGVQKADEENPEARGAFFWGGYFNTTYTADPETGTIGILMKQTFGANEPTTQQFNDFVFATSD